KRVTNLDIFSGKFLEDQGEGVLTMTILGGRGGMPAFGEENGGPLDIKKAKSLVQYLQSSAAAAGGAGGADGKALYAKNCAACHGDSGKSLANADLGSKDYLAKRGDVGLMEAILKGKGGMPALGGSVSQGDAQAIVDYLKKAAGGQ
ncbi:MAG: cytochrome c, partial [Chloroflexi bacterium]|nr:cytochrome c [Chloroflexota bacterium]